MRQLEMRVGSHPERRALPHVVPPWVDYNAHYLITVCCKHRYRVQLTVVPVTDEIRAWLDRHEAAGTWHVLACVVMPDHVHVLATVAAGTDIRCVVTPWKRYLARTYRIRWQRDWFEHRLRQDEHIDAKREYLRQNPVRARLVKRAEDWPYFWTD